MSFEAAMRAPCSGPDAADSRQRLAGMSRCEGLAFRALGSPGQALLGRGGVGHLFWAPGVPRPSARRTFTPGYPSPLLPAGDSKIAISMTTPVRGSQVL